MTGIIRAEVRKVFTTRMWWGMALATVVVGGGLAAAFAALAGQGPASGGLPPLDSPRAMNSVYTSGISFAYLITLAMGVLAIGSEYRHKTITSTFLAAPVRWKVMLAKIVTMILVGVFYGLVFVVSSVAVGATIAKARGFDPFPAGDNIPRTLVLALLALALWALIGLGVGILINNQVAAMIVAVAVAWIGEFIIILAFNGLGWEAATAYLPGQATGAMLAQATPTDSGGLVLRQLSWWAAALVLSGYAVVLAGLGSVRTARADIS